MFKDLGVRALKRLGSCQRMGILSVIKAYKSISLNAVCIFEVVPPMHLALQNDMGKYDIINGYGVLLVNDTILNKNNLNRRVRTYEFPPYNNLNNVNFHFLENKILDLTNTTI